jgi:hypothetical protein
VLLRLLPSLATIKKRGNIQVAEGEKAGRSSQERNGTLKVELADAIRSAMAKREALAGEQIALFDTADQLPADGADGQAPQDQSNGKRGRGRPPGSSNKLTEAFRRYVRANYGDPLLKLVSRAFADPEVVAAQIGLEIGEVWKEQNRLLERLVPYFHAQMPAELKLQGKGFLAVAISSTPGSLHPGDRQAHGDPFGALLELQRNQRLSLSDDPALNAEPLNVEVVSHDPPKG